MKGKCLGHYVQLDLPDPLIPRHKDQANANPHMALQWSE